MPIRPRIFDEMNRKFGTKILFTFFALIVASFGNNAVSLAPSAATATINTETLVDLHFPSSAHITLIKREGQYIQPTGADKLMAGDRLLVLTGNEEELQEALDMLSEK